jgi:hypothetical protein
LTRSSSQTLPPIPSTTHLLNNLSLSSRAQRIPNKAYISTNNAKNNNISLTQSNTSPSPLIIDENQKIISQPSPLSHFSSQNSQTNCNKDLSSSSSSSSQPNNDDVNDCHKNNANGNRLENNSNNSSVSSQSQVINDKINQSSSSTNANNSSSSINPEIPLFSENFWDIDESTLKQNTVISHRFVVLKKSEKKKT